jgi:hypothetical protein
MKGITYATLSTDGSVSLTVSGLIQVFDLNTSTKLESRTSVLAVATVVLGELDILQVMGPDAKSTSTSALTKEVMSSIVDDKAKVQIAGKVDSELDLSNVGGLHSVQREATDGALRA